MEKEHGPQPKAVGSLSRLPIMPRASRDNLRAAGKQSQFGSVKSSLPRLASQHASSKLIPPVPLGENLNKSLVDRYGRTDQSSRQRNRSPVRDALQAAQAAALETTPPNSKNDAPVFDDNDENPIPDQYPIEKRKPRPSLTERTIETLSRIPASPSPTRRRGSAASTDRNMGPPARPASSLRSPRPATPGSRPSSPVKQAFKPPGRVSPTKEHSFPAVPSPGSLYTPPKAFVKGGTIRGVKASKDQRSISTSVTPTQSSQTPRAYSSKTMRVKPSSHASSHRNLESIFRDPEKPDTSGRSAAGGSPGLLKPRSRGENTIASSPGKPKAQRHAANSSRPIATTADFTAQESPQKHLKSSAALRETIAKAKAARKSAGTAARPSTGPDELSMAVNGYAADSIDLVESNEGVLKSRIRAATSSGTLNISALRLKEIPESVLRMYESNEGSITWSEMVDLTKFMAADNEIEILTDAVFPDWSKAEMAEDEEKTNSFGGIEALDLHNNLLCQLPTGLRQLERLSSLNLSGNRLTNAALETIFQLPGLQELNMSRNDLSGTLSVVGPSLATLRSLVLSENKIEQLVVDGPSSALRVLNLSSNRLRRLPWVILSALSLTELNASNNALEGEAFEECLSGFDNIREIDLSRNSFATIARCLSNLAELQICKLNSNRLTDLPDLSGCCSLITLHVAENQLTSMPPGLSSLNTLRNIDVSQNNLKVIDPEIAALESLASLVITGNPLRDRKFLSMDVAELKHELQRRLAPADQNEPDTETFKSAENGHSSSGSAFLFKPLNGTLDLTSKNLSTIDITKIDLESETSTVHTLKLSNNALTALPFELLSHPALKWTLRSLDVSHNPHLHPVEYLTEDLFLPALQTFYIVSTGMATLDTLTTHLKAPALAEINISCGRLTGHVPWIRAWFPNCTSLLASDNWFNSIDVEGIRGLEVLDIRNNYIEELPRKIGLLGNHLGKSEPGRLRAFECGGNKFRVPRIITIEKGSEAVLKDLRRMIPANEVPEEWTEEI